MHIIAGRNPYDQPTSDVAKPATKATSTDPSYSLRAHQAPQGGLPAAVRGQPAPGAARSALGTTAIFGAAFPAKPAPGLKTWEITDSETGEVITVKRAHDCSLQVVQSPDERRIRKYERKAAIKLLLGNRHRIAACHAHPIRGRKDVEVWSKTGALVPGHFVGLQTCALGWLCPVCAPKIAERRAAEIESAMTICRARGGQVLMPTFTVPHERRESLAELLDKMKEARRWMGRHRQYRKLVDEMNLIGFINATEVTHGEANGWHPHFHELWFFETDGVDVKALEQRLYDLWCQACAKFGLGAPSRRHGVVVQDGSKAARYVAKMGQKEWSLSDEIAKSNAKAGRGGNRSVWQLLDCFIDSDASPAHQKRAGALFKEYAEATKGRRQLAWSKGLKNVFAVTEMTDEELCAQVEEDAVLVATISLDDWRIIRKNNLQAHILNAVRHGAEAVQIIMHSFRRTFGPKEVPA